MALLTSGKKFAPEYPASLVKQITDFLTNAIVKGLLKSGRRLVEAELQREFKVSRATIRESFRILEKTGLVVNIPRKGTYVRTITREFVEENFPIRALLESLAARLAVSHLKTEDIGGMELALSRMDRAAKKRDFKSYLKYHHEFHNIFIHASKNNTLVGILESLRHQAIWFRFTYLAVSYVQESFGRFVQVHREILDLFIRKDANRVEAQVKEHILAAGHKFLQVLTSKSEN
jgi:DNA-binding GntR family transcriptional regulator